MSRSTDVVYVSPCAKEAGRRSLPPSRDAMLLSLQAVNLTFDSVPVYPH
jgi:hypothetical protein